jgi:adenylate cyclase
VPRTQSRFSVFLRAVPKGSTILGVLLHLLNLLCCFLIFVRFGLLVDAASIFIILSAVMGCFFAPALLHGGERGRTEAGRAKGGEEDRNGAGKARGP